MTATLKTKISRKATHSGYLLPVRIIERRIYVLRGQKVILDRDLAELYGVSTKVSNQAVKRNRDRFPDDFMFRLTLREGNELLADSRSQIVTLKRGRNIKYAPYAFTQEGVAMLSGVLNSDRAVRVNIEIMRAFVSTREIALTHSKVAKKLAELEKKYKRHDTDIKEIFETIGQLIEPPSSPHRQIGFRSRHEKDTAG